MHVVICGGGVIGAATAYELSRHDVRVTLVERCEVGCAASGKSGGFLARDWCEGTPVAAMAERSFDLHAEWAERLGNSYGYRRVDTYSAGMSARRKLAGRPTDEAVASWLASDAVGRSQLGTTGTTAQLDPFAFTNALAEAAVENGATVCLGEVVGIEKSRDDSRVTGVALADGTRVDCDALVLALGPWSLLAARWLPLPPIYGLKGHSLIFRPDAPLPAEAIFAQYEEHDGEVFAPEIVPRPDGTLYVCGLSGHAAMPVDPARVVPEEGGCEKLREITIGLVPALADAEIIAEQACYRPVTQDGSACHRRGAGHRGRLRGDGTFGLGHVECTGNR